MPTSAPSPTLDLSIGPKAGMLPSFSINGILPVVFTIVFIIWAIYTLIIVYHWFRYGHQSWFAVPVVVSHLTVSAVILLFIMSGLH